MTEDPLSMKFYNPKIGRLIEITVAADDDSQPHSVPPDRVVVHNNVRPTRQLGSRGFRAWLCPSLEVLRVTPDPGRPVLQLCDCGWAPELGPHYRVKGRWLG